MRKYATVVIMSVAMFLCLAATCIAERPYVNFFGGDDPMTIPRGLNQDSSNRWGAEKLPRNFIIDPPSSVEGMPGSLRTDSGVKNDPVAGEAAQPQLNPPNMIDDNVGNNSNLGVINGTPLGLQKVTDEFWMVYPCKDGRMCTAQEWQAGL